MTFAPTLKQNLAVEIECVLERGETLAILFDRTERDNFYALVVGYNGRAYFEKWTNGRPSLLGEPIEEVGVRGPLKVTLTRQGGKLTGTVGRRTITAEAQPRSGTLGLFAPSGELAVDQVRITAELDAAWLRKNLGAEAK